MDSNKLPWGFSAIFHTYCNSCPNFEAKVTGAKIMSTDGETWGHWNISCQHYNTCSLIKKHIQKEIPDGSKDI